MAHTSAVPVAEVARRSIALDGLLSAEGHLWWIESGPDSEDPAVVTWSAENGRSVFHAPVGSSLHAYGGGALLPDAAGFWYVHASDGQIWRSGSTRPLTHEHRTLGDLTVAGSSLLSVAENPTFDELLIIDKATGRTRAIHAAPFLSSPRLYGDKLAWVQWAADAMPWDSSELWLGSLDPSYGLASMRRIAGGAGISVTEPQWSLDGHLHYMSDSSGWWNLYRWLDGGAQPIAPIAADCAAAPWEHGYSSYAFLPGEWIAMVVQNGPRHRLMIASGRQIRQELNNPITSIKPYLATYGSNVAMIGASPVQSSQIALASSGELQVIWPNQSSPITDTVSIPQQLSFTSAGAEINIWFYPANVSDPIATIVRAHSGPTYQSDLRFDWETQFFTSRGFAVADVDYRGSTGYGRAFRTALNGQWGVVDVQDCAEAANHLVRLGAALPGALVIYGASAGGFTALRSVCTPQTPFAAAVTRSPIVNPMTWRQTAPRFQQPHAATLAGQHSLIDPARICRPVALVHGAKDSVAPIGDARQFVKTLHDAGSPARFLELPGAGHYLSGQALVEALEFELAAFVEVVGRSLS